MGKSSVNDYKWGCRYNNMALMICNFMGYITEKYDFTSYSGMQTEAMPG